MKEERSAEVASPAVMTGQDAVWRRECGERMGVRRGSQEPVRRA
jgi:hypothetical protein